MDTENWYYVTPYKKKAGPVTRNRLFALYLKDKVLPSTLVWSPGMEKWVPFVDKFDGVAPPRVEHIVPPPIEATNTATGNTAVGHCFHFAVARAEAQSGAGSQLSWLYRPSPYGLCTLAAFGGPARLRVTTSIRVHQ